MPANFIEVDSPEALETAFADSNKRAVLIFKHSNRCSISSEVFRDVSTLDSDVHLVVVQNSRAISDSIATRIGVKHQSPQAIVIENGKVIFHASHFDVTAEELSKFLSKN